MGQARLPTTEAARPAPWVGLAVRRGLRRTRGRCRTGDGLHQCRSNEHASRRDQLSCRGGRACCGRARRCRLAPNRRTTAGPRQHHPDAAATLLSGAQPGRKRVAISPPKRTQLQDLGQHRRHRRCLLRRLEQTRQQARNHHLNRNTKLGKRVRALDDWYYPKILM